MSSIESSSLVRVLAAAVGLCSFLGQVQNSFANVNYRGFWEGRENDQGSIIQRDDHVFSLNLEQNVSERLISHENVNYGYQWEQGVGTQETASPGASLAMRGDLFSANMAVNSLRNVNSQSLQSDTDTIGVNWESHWQKNFIPEVGFNYDYFRATNDRSDRFVDENRKNLGGEIRWDLRLIQAIYNYNHSESKYESYQLSQDSHMARVNATKDWFDNRLRLNMGHEYNESRNENSIAFTSSATVAQPVKLYSASTGIESLPGNPTTIPPDTSDTATYLISDPNSPLSAPAYSVPVGNNNYIRLENISGKPVDHIYLYTQNNLGSIPNGLIWRLYYNNGDYTVNPWNKVEAISVSYDQINQRFVVNVPSLSARYLKVVIDRIIGTENINITEVKVESIEHGIVGSNKSTVTNVISNKSNFSFDLRLNEVVGFYYSFLRGRDEADGAVTNDRQNHNGGFRLQNTAGDLKSNLSYSLLKNRFMGGQETETKTYLVDIVKAFLPTLTVALSGSHEESSNEGFLILDRNRYSLYSDATLYPDLTSRFEVIYWTQESFRPGVTSSLWDDLRTQFTLTSRFKPSLVVSLVDAYEVQNQDSRAFDRKNSAYLTGSWQLSEWYSVSGSIQKEDSLISTDFIAYTLGMVVGLGRGLELKGNYSVRDAELISQSGQVSLRWSAHQNVSWEIGCDYAERNDGATQNAYKVYSRLMVGIGMR